MKNTFFIFIFIFFAATLMTSAQEQAKYRVAYDSSQEFTEGLKETSRWHLDIGDNTAVFYNQNFRGYMHENDSLLNLGDGIALMAALPALDAKYKGTKKTQVLFNAPKRGFYTFYDDCSADGSLYYEEKMPSISWVPQDGTQTICGYECSKAEGTVYGRTWTVWYTDELPFQYGPYILSGVPGLILAASESEGLFSFTAVGIEKAPSAAKVEMIDMDVQKCSRKRFLELRNEKDNMSAEDVANYIAQKFGASINQVKVVDNAGKEITGEKKVKKHYHFDKE